MGDFELESMWAGEGCAGTVWYGGWAFADRLCPCDVFAVYEEKRLNMSELEDTDGNIETGLHGGAPVNGVGPELLYS